MKFMYMCDICIIAISIVVVCMLYSFCNTCLWLSGYWAAHQLLYYDSRQHRLSCWTVQRTTWGQCWSQSVSAGQCISIGQLVHVWFYDEVLEVWLRLSGSADQMWHMLLEAKMASVHVMLTYSMKRLQWVSSLQINMRENNVRRLPVIRLVST